MEGDYSQRIQDLVIKKGNLGNITDEELKNSFLAHMRKARHTEGDWIEFKFALMTLQEMQTRENTKALRWSWFWGFVSALSGAVDLEILKLVFK